MALLYWTRFPVPELSTSRLARLPIGDSLADDPGLYWITGPLMRLTGLDVTHAVWLLALVAFAVALYRLHGWPSLALAISAPWYIEAGGPYWIPAWAVWMGGGALLAVVVTPFRATAGLVALAMARSWRRALLGLVGVVAIGALGSHVLWHSIYIGLGWFGNPWGITYLDASGMAATTLPYATPEYEAALRSLVIEHVTEQPWWFMAQLVAKLGAALALTFPWCLAVPFHRRTWLPFLAALLPMVAIAPVPAYAVGALAVGMYALGSGDYRWVLSRARAPRRADRQREQQPATGDVVVAPGAG